MNRIGRCFELAGNKMIDLPPDTDWVLVHGLPIGTGGKVKGLVYPHGWCEWGSDLVYDFVADLHIKAIAYYAAGNIGYTVKYTRSEASRLMLSTGHYGPWDKTIKAAGKKVEKIVLG